MPAERLLFSQTGKKDNPGASEQGDQHFFQDDPNKRGRLPPPSAWHILD
jgi:hypothetical protein